jgi:two-component sensor histidine kinase
VILGIFALLCWQGFGTTVTQAQARAQTAADVVADNVEWAFAAALSDLRLIAANGTAATDPALRPGFEAALSALPAGSQLGFYDATGHAVAGNPAGLPAAIGDREFFQALKSGTDGAISRQTPDAASGKPLMLIGQRLGATAFEGAAVLAIPADVLEAFWEPQKLGTDSNVNVHRDDGWLVGRYPPVAQPFDASKVSNAWPQVTGSTAGTYTSKSPLDGITRIVGYRHVPDLKLVVFATISQDAAFAGLWTAIITVLWLIVPIALALLVGSLITARILRQSARTQASLAAAVAHNEVLFREIHHRVKNNLQSVGSLLQMQPIPKEIKANMGQRIAAMSAVHEHIYRSSDFANVRVQSYLATLIENIRAGADPTVHVVEQLEDLSVDKDAATPLGLILNEVVANAFKHAFPDGRSGVITVRLTRDTDGRGLLTVEDNGIGFDPEKPATGIGRRLIKALTAQIGGTSAFSIAEGGGSRFTLSFPLAKGVGV